MQEEFLYHELLDRTSIIQQIWSDAITRHSLLDCDVDNKGFTKFESENLKTLRKKAHIISGLMADLYQKIGEISLDVKHGEVDEMQSL